MFLFQHPSAQFSLSPSLTLSLSHFISLLSSSFLFFSSQNALLTKRFTNPGWYIIHDRLLWDWFKQMDSGREGGTERRGFAWKGWKRRKWKGVCSSGAAALQNRHMGHVEYSPFLCILRSHTLNAHYTAFICKRRRLLCEGRAAEDGLWSPCICMHGASLEAFWHVWYHHDREIWLSYSPTREREGVSIARLIFTVWIRLCAMFNKVDFSGFSHRLVHEGVFCDLRSHKPHPSLQ